jgi:hypothetical protein
VDGGVAAAVVAVMAAALAAAVQEGKLAPWVSGTLAALVPAVAC